MISIDELPSNWSIEQIEEICTFNPKHDRKFSDDVEISFVPMDIIDQQTGTIKKHDSKLLGEVRKGYTHFADGDIIFAKITPCMENGKSAVARNLINGLACGSTEFHVLRSDNGVLPDYLLNFLRQASYLGIAAGKMTGVVGQRRLPKEFLLTTKIPLPPLNEQRRIVAKIEALKARSQRVKEALEDIPQLLDQFRQSVLAAAFRGDLTADWREQNPDVEPASVLIERIASQMIRGKETGRAATINVIPGCAALSVGNTQMPVPKNWFRVPLLKIARLESGHTPSRKHPEYWDGDIPWIGIADAREHHGKYIFHTLQHINEKGLANSAARLLPKNTVCLSRTASVGYAVIMGQQMATSQDFVNWICSDALLPEFLLYAFLAEGEYLLRFGKGTTHTTIYFPEVKAFHITLPPLKEQKEIVQKIELFLKYLTHIEKQYQMAQGQLDSLDQSILAKAFRGELVPQDPNDEPASVLLERIRAERDKLQTKAAKKSTPQTGGRRSKKALQQQAEPVQLELGLE